MSVEDVITASLEGLPGRGDDSEPVDSPANEIPEVEEGEGTVEEADASTEPTDALTGDEEIEGQTTEPGTETAAELDEFGLAAKDASGRTNRIPYPRVQKIAQNAQAKILKDALGIDVPKDAKGNFDFGAAISTAKGKIEDFETRIQGHQAREEEVAFGERIMMDEPEQVLDLLPMLNPKYTELLAARTAPEPVEEMPGPDIDPGGENPQYSLPQWEKRLLWERNQATKAAQAHVDKQLKPLKDAQDAARKAADAEQEYTRSRATIQSTLTEARTEWDGFKDHEDAILVALREDRESAAKSRTKPKLNLERAYIKVVLPKIRADRNKMREEILAERKAAPTSTSVAVAVPPKKKDAVIPPGTDAVTAAIKRSIANLPR
jgi:hypothetical protein